jgi:superoxide dismutase, Cu-Zn family
MNTLVLAVAIAGLLYAGRLPAQAQPRTAVAEIRGCADAAIAGHAQLSELPSQEGVKQILVELTVNGLSDGKHGVHIHEAANCQPCTAAGGHFDPGPASNPSPDGNHPFHAGDLINIDVHGGYGVLLALTTRITLASGPLSLFDSDGSAFIIHEKPDTYCPNGEVHDCAGGGRVACGIIERVEE